MRGGKRASHSFSQTSYVRSCLQMDSSPAGPGAELDSSREDRTEDEEPEPKRSRIENTGGQEDPLARLLQSPGTTEQPPRSAPALPRLDLSAAGMRPGPSSLLDTPTTPHPDGPLAQEQRKREQASEEREKMQLLVSRFTEDQLDRYAMYRRSALPKMTVKKLMQTMTGCSVGHNVVIAMAGIAKVFAGEVIEEALATMEKSGEGAQPIRPKHLREAVRKMRSKGLYMPKHKKQCPF